MITDAALLPHPPLLFRELGGAQDPVAELRAAALDAVRVVTREADRVVVVGAADTPGRWDGAAPVDARRFGTTGSRTPVGTALPLSLGVGRRLVDEVGWGGPVELVACTWDATGEDIEALANELADRPERTALLVLGDGSARRGDKAPGYLDERAFPFDDAVADALARGDAQALCDLDPGLAEELMVFGRTVFRLLGAVAVAQQAVTQAALTYRGDPFGVSWFVATWQLHRA